MRPIADNRNLARAGRPKPERRAVRPEDAGRSGRRSWLARERDHAAGRRLHRRVRVVRAVFGIVVRGMKQDRPVAVFVHAWQLEFDRLRRRVEDDVERLLAMLHRPEHIGEKPALRKIPVGFGHFVAIAASATTRHRSRPRFLPSTHCRALICANRFRRVARRPTKPVMSSASWPRLLQSIHPISLS